MIPVHTIRRYEHVLAPPLDRREYRGLELENGLKVMLISDKLTETSAASLVVGVGEFKTSRRFVRGHIELPLCLMNPFFRVRIRSIQRSSTGTGLGESCWIRTAGWRWG